jgi:hypothetical protein
MGVQSLRRAAWAGLQDSMPRAALLSLHARVEGVEPSTWDHASLAQLWGPRYQIYVVAKRDFALFSLGRFPDSAKGRLRAERMADQLRAHLERARMTDRDIGRALGLGNELRYGATTGRLAIRWDGARAPVVWTVAPAEIDPAEARRELARRYLHIFGPTTADGFAHWAGVSRRAAADAFASLEDSLLPVRSPLGDQWLLADDEPAMRADETSDEPARLLPSGDAYFLLHGAERELLVPGVAGGAPRRRRNPRDLAAREPHRAGRPLGTALAQDARGSRGRGRRPPASRRRPGCRGGLEYVSF